MSNLDGREQAEAELLKTQDEDVKSALKEARTEPAPPQVPAEKPQPAWFLPYLIAIAGLVGLYALWDGHLIAQMETWVPLLLHLTTAAIIVTLLLATQHAVTLYLIGRVESAAST